METMTVLARGLHFAALVSLAGSLAFLALIAEPALAQASVPPALRLRRQVARIVWASLALALLSGLLWLLIEARSMSGQPFAAILRQDILATVLMRTKFGHDWLLRLALCTVLAAVMVWRDRRPRRSAALDAVALALAGGALAALAWAGHAGATSGEASDVHLLSDALHLLAAGVWLGGLLPLALLLGHSRDDLSWLAVARIATRRFSVLGIVCVGTLLVTGVINSWILVGSIPGLVGTPYGQELLLKLALFTAMVAVAAVNRRRLTPRLFASAAPVPPLRTLRRNALIETALGLAILLVVGALGARVPAAHAQPLWPFPFRLDLDAVPPDPALARTAAVHGALVGLGLALLLVAARRRRGRWIAAASGTALVVGFGWLPLSWTLVEAYPTSFYRSPVAYAVPSLLRGSRLYQANCAPCHGADGSDDGPTAHDLLQKPADLTAGHLFAPRSGDLFWWITAGRSGVMPPFAPVLTETERWDVINFIRARAAAAQLNALLPQVTPGPAPLAPDFAFEQGDRQDTLGQARQEEAVLLVFYRLPFSLPRLQALAAAEPRLRAAGLRLVAIPLAQDAAETETETETPLPDLIAATGPETAQAYALFGAAPSIPHVEFLIDRGGFLRARWDARTEAGLPGPGTLLAQLYRLAIMPLASVATHVHAH